MKKRHYHVMSGMHGCLPERDVAFKYKNAALQDMADWVEECRDSGGKFQGSLKEGYYECTNPAATGLGYIELIECYVEDCLEDEDE